MTFSLSRGSSELALSPMRCKLILVLCIETNDITSFILQLAAPADLYVNDAFGSAHRAHASTEGVTHYLKPNVAGFLMQKVVALALSPIIRLRLRGRQHYLLLRDWSTSSLHSWTSRMCMLTGMSKCNFRAMSLAAEHISVQGSEFLCHGPAGAEVLGRSNPKSTEAACRNCWRLKGLLQDPCSWIPHSKGRQNHYWVSHPLWPELRWW